MGTHNPASRWPLVARDAELAAFGEQWATGRFRGCVLWGPAGVGKTRLAEECLARAARDGYRTARARATAGAGTVPLGAIAHLIPATVDLSDPAAGFPRVAAALAGPHGDRRWAFLIDDLHLLDATSAVLLRQLSQTRAVRLIATVRAGEPVSEAVLALCAAEGVSRTELAELDREQVAEVLEAALGGRVGRRAVRDLHTASGGNVLYLRELVTGALAAGTLYGDGQIWELNRSRSRGTPKLAELMAARLSAADRVGRPVLELLALCGTLSLADARAVVSRDVLAGLEDSGLIEVTTDRRRATVQFLHPLYGEAVRAELPTLRRRTLLLGQIERVEAYGARRREDVLNLATWRLAAHGTADPALLLRAATLARHVRDYRQVVFLLRSLSARDHTARSQLLLGEALFELGDATRAEETLVGAAGLAATDAERLDVAFARTLNLFWAANDVAATLAVNTAARESLSGADEQRMLRVNEGALRAASGGPARSLELLDELDPDPRLSPNSSVWLMAAMMKPVALAVTGRAEEAVAFAGRAYDLHRRLDEQSLLFAPIGHLISQTLALAEAGRLAEARTVGHGAWETHGHEQNPVTWIWLAFHQARTEWLAGHVEPAHRWFAETVATCRTFRIHRGMRLGLAGLAACAALTGDIAAAESIEREAAEHPPSDFRAGEDRLGEAWLYAARGQLAEARRTLTEAAASARVGGDLASEGLLLTDLARLGGPEPAADRLASIAQRCDGVLAAARAALAAALAAGDPEALADVSGELEAIGADLLAAEAASATSAAWTRAGHTHRAAAAARRSAACAARCGAVRTPLLAPAPTAAALTAREREIALLAAGGSTSKDIAASLRLSVRTVDNHLQSVYRRLGVSGRRELAWALGGAGRS
ncbi:LuxR C-terminal-related transcriptional regulator [Streptomyces sp. NPDC051976]|uniref:LuxR C-terminal-related transcriptional regulator n=1 Tax=Streptomyces sp. NPDC051976 TaxID=3154947 RepID=UPI00343DFDCB